MWMNLLQAPILKPKPLPDLIPFRRIYLMNDKKMLPVCWSAFTLDGLW